MIKNKLIAFLIILLMLSLPLANIYAVDPNSPEGDVVNIEESIRSTKLSDFENNTDFQNLSDDKKNIFRYVYAVTGKDMAITSEVYGQMGKIWTADDFTLYANYITGNDNVKKSIKDNDFFANRLGYLNKYVSDWQHLSDKEKVAFFNTDKHTINNAFRVLQNADKNELTYINGNLIVDNESTIDATGYDSITSAFERLYTSANKKVSAEDGKLFEDSCSEFVESVYRYHFEYKNLNSSTKDNVTNAIQKVLAKNPKQMDVKKHLNGLKIKFNDIANTMNKMATSAVANEITFTTAGTILVVAGIVTIIIGCVAANASVVLGGVGLIAGGIFCLATGSPSLGDNLDIKELSGKMKDWCTEMNPLLDYMIAHIGNDTAGGK
jgi:hypothetical protein